MFEILQLAACHGHVAIYAVCFCLVNWTTPCLQLDVMSSTIIIIISGYNTPTGQSINHHISYICICEMAIICAKPLNFGDSHASSGITRGCVCG